MNAHEQCLRLAAVAIDFQLDDRDRSALDWHLGDCPICTRTVAAMRIDAASIASLPPRRLADRRSDAILVEVLSRPKARGPILYLAVAAILALLALGAIVVGAEVVQRRPPVPLLVVNPSPSTDSDPAACVPAPSVVELVDLGGARAAACLGSSELQLVGFIPLGDGSTVCEGWEPQWLSCPSGSFIASRAGRDAPLLAYGHRDDMVIVRPSTGPAAARDAQITGFYARFTGHYNDPAASECRVVTPGVAFFDDPEGLRRRCHETLVVTRLEILAPEDVPKPAIDARWTRIAGPDAFGSPASTSLIVVEELDGSLYAVSRELVTTDPRNYRLWKSSDGSTWSEIAPSGFVPRGLASGDGHLFAFGDIDGTDVRISEDGRTWRSIPGMGEKDQIAAVAETSAGLFATGAVGIDGAIWRFADNRWVPTSVAEAKGISSGQDASPAMVNGISDVNGQLVAWGRAPTPPGVGYTVARFWTSSDGVDWARAADPPGPVAAIPVVARQRSDQFASILAGFRESDSMPVAWVRRGLDWEEGTFFGKTTMEGAGVVGFLAELDGVMIGVGYEFPAALDGSMRSTVWGTTDGASWWPVDAGDLDGGFVEDGIVTSDGRVLAVGRWFLGEGRTVTSPHGPAVFELRTSP
jgi:hypothetical protein